MEKEKLYDTGLENTETLICTRCNLPLTIASVSLSYLGNGFPVELPCCSQCGMYYIPEELAMGKMLHVEKSLEDK